MMERLTTHCLAACVTWITLAPATASASQQEFPVHFDLPPTAVAVPADDRDQVTITLRLSSLIQTPAVPKIDQWIVTCRPRGEDIAVVDYFPKTETSSDVSSPIQVEQSQETTRSIGIHLDGSYGHTAGGNASASSADKDRESVQYSRVAPVQAVSAAGTIDRGRGVYFKLRWTATQILEGEKQFQVTLQVPRGWRGSLMDVSVRADRHETKFGGLDEETVVLGAAEFVVAAYREGDGEALAQAQRLSNTEQDLRRLAMRASQKQPIRTLPQMLRHVVAKFDSDSDPSDTRWVNRLVTGRADPHLDKTIHKLPMPLRIAALQYADVRQEFSEMSRGTVATASDTHDHTLVGKPVLP